MVARPHIAAVLEDGFSIRIEKVLRRRGHTERVIGYTGYGTPSRARVMARVVLRRPPKPGDPEALADAEATEAQLDEAEERKRGWRSFVTAPVMDSPVRIELGGTAVTVRTDRSGYFDTVIHGHGLEPGWHHASITAVNGDSVHSAVQIVDPQVDFGIVSDIDDTVMVTHLPRMLLAFWNTFIRSQQGREVVPGMAALYRSLLAEKDGAPIFYLSTGAWNTAPTLTRFLWRNDYPPGALLLTDWGPTNTGWFRSGRQHKADQLYRLMYDFPNIRWVLVGDDGQHDTTIYGDFAEQQPDAVEVVAIRRLTATQHVLSHVLPVATDELLGSNVRAGVPMVKAPDGFTLHRLIHHARKTAARAAQRAARVAQQTAAAAGR